MVRPPGGAGDEMLRVRFVVAPVSTIVLWLKLRVSLTFTVPLPLLKPGDDALMVAEVKFTPVT